MFFRGRGGRTSSTRRATYRRVPHASCTYCVSVRHRVNHWHAAKVVSVYCAIIRLSDSVSQSVSQSVRNAPSLCITGGSLSHTHSSELAQVSQSSGKWHVHVHVTVRLRVRVSRREAPPPPFFPPINVAALFSVLVLSFLISYSTVRGSAPPHVYPYSIRPAATRKKENTRYRSHDRHDPHDRGHHDDHHDSL
jgi:hypothetical protein